MSTSSKGTIRVTYDQCVKNYDGLKLGVLCTDMCGHPSGLTMAYIVSSFTKTTPESTQKNDIYTRKSFLKYSKAS